MELLSERVYYSLIVLGREIREQLYHRLSDFDFHYKMTNVFKHSVSDSSKSKEKSKEVRDDETHMNEALRCVAEAFPTVAKALNIKFPITY
ncbi:6733_t:CDS:2, partial [Scutellospora calospora]